MVDEKSIGERVDEVVSKVSDKVDQAKAKLATAKVDVAGIARDLAKGVKRAAEDAGDTVKDLINKKT